MKAIVFTLFIALVSTAFAKTKVIPLVQNQFHTQFSQDTVKLNPVLNNSVIYFNSTMPALSVISPENMPIRKPDPLINYHLLKKQVIIVNPFEEEGFSEKPFNGQLPLE